MKPIKANTPLEQIFKNTRDIEILKQKIAPLYKCSSELSDESISVARNLTNVSEDVETGFLIDPVGNTFKITGNDNSSLLLEYYTTIHGATGPQGADGADGQDGQDGQDGANGTSIRYTSTDLNENVGYSTTILKANINPNDDLQLNDLIISINGYLGKIFNIDELSVDVRTIVQIIVAPNIIDDDNSSTETTYSSDKIDDLIANAGKTLYMHSINFVENNSGNLLTQATTTVITEDATPFTYDTFKQWLINNGFGFTSDNWYNFRQFLQASGLTIASGVIKNVYGIMTFSSESSHIQAVFITDGSGTLPIDRRNINKNDTNLTDKVTEL